MCATEDTTSKALDANSIHDPSQIDANWATAAAASDLLAAALRFALSNYSPLVASGVLTAAATPTASSSASASGSRLTKGVSSAVSISPPRPAGAGAAAAAMSSPAASLTLSRMSITDDNKRRRLSDAGPASVAAGSGSALPPPISEADTAGVTATMDRALALLHASVVTATDAHPHGAIVPLARDPTGDPRVRLKSGGGTLVQLPRC
jgi:hypothetical protein